jgi:hypothetical protein
MCLFSDGKRRRRGRRRRRRGQTEAGRKASR